MKVSEAIEKLTIKRDDALHFQKLYRAGDVGWSANESKAIAFNIAINTLEQIDEPQADKVEVPDWFDQWYKKLIVDCSYHESKALVLINQCGDGHVLENFDGGIFGGTAKNSVIYTGWINSNRELASRAILDGYTVKPKRWVVKDSDGEYVYDLHLCHIDTTAHSSNTTQFDILTFTDKSKADAVATLVDGTVEEV